MLIHIYKVAGSSRFLDSDTFFVILPLFATTVDFKSNNQDEIQVQVNSRLIQEVLPKF